LVYANSLTDNGRPQHKAEKNRSKNGAGNEKNAHLWASGVLGVIRFLSGGLSGTNGTLPQANTFLLGANVFCWEQNGSVQSLYRVIPACLCYTCYVKSKTVISLYMRKWATIVNSM